MSIEAQIEAMGRQDGSGFAADIRDIIERLKRKYRQKLLDEFQSKTKSRVDDVLADRITTSEAGDQSNRDLSKLAQVYYSNMREDMIEEIKNLYEEYRENYFHHRAQVSCPRSQGHL